MIEVEAIEINGVFYPIEIPSENIGSHFDGVKFIFFTSEEARNEFFSSFGE